MSVSVHLLSIGILIFSAGCKGPLQVEAGQGLQQAGAVKSLHGVEVATALFRATQQYHTVSLINQTGSPRGNQMVLLQ